MKTNPKILIFSKNKIQFGQVRFDKNLNNFYEIDYSIIRNYRGKGYSTKILKSFKIYPKKKIIAKVKHNNKISKKKYSLSLNLK